MYLTRKLSTEDRVSLAAAIQQQAPAAKIAEELWRIATTATNTVARVAALRALAEWGHGKPAKQVEIVHTTPEQVERRRLTELLAERAPAVLEEIAGWAERVEPPALPEPAPLCACGTEKCMGAGRSGAWCHDGE